MIHYSTAFFAMLLTAILGFTYQPRLLLSEFLPGLNLEQQVPESFGSWVSVTEKSSLIIEPEQQAIINEIYTQTLSRTYQNTVTGVTVMLSIAYGDRQTDGKEVHKPEVCYPAQGFSINDFRAINLVMKNQTHSLNAVSMIAKNDYRTEPIIYWTTLGNKTYNSRIQKKIYEFEYALKGYIPDGLLFRVSVVEGDTLKANKEIRSFVNDLYSSLDTEEKNRFFGI